MRIRKNGLTRLATLLLFFLFAGQLGICDINQGYFQKVEITSETDLDEETEIQLVCRRKFKKSVRPAPQPTESSHVVPIKVPTHFISHSLGLTTSREILFRSLLI